MTKTSEESTENSSFIPVRRNADETNKFGERSASSFGARHVQALIMFSLSVIAFGARAFLSVAIVAMTDPNTNTNSEVPTYPEWTDKSIVLSAFFWGYVLPQAFAGWAANRYGPKWFLVVTMAIGSCLGILVPCTAAHLGSKGVMAIRAVQGITQGFVYPSIHYLLSQWAPLSERSRMGTFVMAGGPLGTVISLLITGVLASSKYGWPLVFYFYGVLGLLWCIVMVLCGYNSPVEHPSINSSERSFIESSLGHADGKMRHPTPWKSIFLSTPVWALLIAQSGYSFVFYVLLTQIPSYLNHVMEFDIANNSLLSSLPYFVLWILSFVFSVTSDAAINRKVLSVGASRKLFNGIGMVIPAIALVILGYTSREQTTQAIILMVLSVGFLSATLSGWGVNHIDLSPNHAGTLMGLINAAANCFGIVAPLLAQFVVTDQEDTVQWRIVFLISAASNIAVTVLFTIFGSGEVQPWNMEEHENSKR